MTNRYPDAIIIGAQRCGTTTLYNLLMQHPGIADSGQPRLEVSHFCNYSSYTKGLDHYAAQFSATENQLIVEKSPPYFDHPLVPQRIKDTGLSPIFIVCLRNPTDRAYSHYWKAVAKWFEGSNEFYKAAKKSQEKLLHENITLGNSLWRGRFWLSAHHLTPYIQRGRYAQHLRLWFKSFPREQFVIIKSEELYQNPAKEAGRVAAKLFGNDQYFSKIATAKRWQRLYYDPMPDAVRVWLDRQFAKSNRELAQLLGDDKWLWGD